MERYEWAAFSPVASRTRSTAFDSGRLTSDAWVLVLAEIERRLGIAERLAHGLANPRAAERVPIPRTGAKPGPSIMWWSRQMVSR